MTILKNFESIQRFEFVPSWSNVKINHHQPAKYIYVAAITVAATATVQTVNKQTHALVRTNLLPQKNQKKKKNIQPE